MTQATNSALDRLVQTPMLPSERTQALLKKAKAGDIAAEDTIIRHSAKLLRYALGFLDYPDALIDDLYQEGQLALRGAIKSYRADLGTTWTTYAYICAWRKMNSALSKDSNTYLHSTDAPTLIASLTVEENEGPEEELVRIFDQVYVREHLCILSTREKQVVCSFYALQTPYKPTLEVAAELGVSKQRVHQIRERALQKLRLSMTQSKPPSPITA